MSASKKRLDIFENNAAPKLTNTDSIESKTASKTDSRLTSVVDSKVSPKVQDITSVKEIDTLISNTPKKTIQDVLEIERDRPVSSIRRQTSEEKEKQHYSVDTSSIKSGEKRSKVKAGGRYAFVNCLGTEISFDRSTCSSNETR